MALAERELLSGEWKEPELEPSPVSWTKAQYYEMHERGWFEDRRVELIDGVIYEMAPIGTKHWSAVNKLNQILGRVFGEGYTVSIQNAVDANKKSEPQPDALVVPGDPFDYEDALPISAVLAVEVADTSLQHDRRKAEIYARAGIQEYWIVNLRAREIEVRRKPSGQRDVKGTGIYEETTVYKMGEHISPMAAPGANIAVDRLMAKRS